MDIGLGLSVLVRSGDVRWWGQGCRCRMRQVLGVCVVLGIGRTGLQKVVGVMRWVGRLEFDEHGV